MSGTIPIVLTAAGRTNTPPAVLNAEIIANATSLAPGLTVLPAGLIEDMSSTATGAAVVIDQLVTELINSITPFGANAFVLTELGQIYLGQGSTASPATNTSVYVVFSGTVGFIVPPGFTISDGTYQYTVQDGTTIESGGTSAITYCLAVQSGSWAVPANSVINLVTSVPEDITLTVTNPLAGTSGAPAQSEANYRAQVLQAGLVTSTGTPDYLKTLLLVVPGVQSNLISIRVLTGAWEIIVGGTGDPYAIAYAIYQSGVDISTLVGSTLAVSGITAASNGVVTTTLNHGYSTGQAVTIAGVSPGGYNQTYASITVLTETTFETNINTSGYGAYVSGGVCTPNFRNTSATINSYPDSYTVPFVLPPSQAVTMTVTWNTTSLNYVSPTGVAQLAQPPLAAYINAIPVGAPINIFDMNAVFQVAVVSIIPTVLLTRLVFTVYINGVMTGPESGTGIVAGDPESYFTIAASSITVVQG